MAKLSFNQHKALTLMVQDKKYGYKISPHSYNKSTLTALASRGLIVKVFDNYVWSIEITDAGYEALGMQAPSAVAQPVAVETQDTSAIDAEIEDIELRISHLQAELLALKAKRHTIRQS